MEKKKIGNFMRGPSGGMAVVDGDGTKEEEGRCSQAGGGEEGGRGK